MSFSDKISTTSGKTKNSENSTDQKKKPSTHSIINDALNSPASHLDSQEQAYMNDKLDYNFSNVKIHTNETAAKSATALNANAYTIGQDIIFSTGQYNPKTTPGKQLLTHELVHVIQQQQSPTYTPSNFENLNVGSDQDSVEQEATKISLSQSGFSQVQEQIPYGEIHCGKTLPSSKPDENEKYCEAKYGEEDRKAKAAQEENDKKLGTRIKRGFKSLVGSATIDDLTLAEQEEILGQLSDAYGTAERLSGIAADTVEALNNLQETEGLEDLATIFKDAKEKFGEAKGVVDKVTDTITKVTKIMKFIKCAKNLPDINGSMSPEKQAKRWDEMFAATGDLLESLGIGMFGYTDFLKHFKEGFFTPVTRGILPQLRQRERNIAAGDPELQKLMGQKPD